MYIYKLYSSAAQNIAVLENTIQIQHILMYTWAKLVGISGF